MTENESDDAIRFEIAEAIWVYQEAHCSFGPLKDCKHARGLAGLIYSTCMDQAEIIRKLLFTSKHVKSRFALVPTLFREFVLHNATQWEMGANDHNHPIWVTLANNVNGAELPPFDRGPYWAFIQPRNRIPLETLLDNAEPVLKVIK